jgi:hypothetical protein
MVIMLVALSADDPRATTIGGTFGNPEFDRVARPVPRAAEPRRSLMYDAREPVNCRYCRTVVTPDLSQCPRCARARWCRTCERPLGAVLDRPTCPSCAREEPFCSCSPLARPPRMPIPSTRGRSIP